MLWVALPVAIPVAAIPWRVGASLAIGLVTIGAVACSAAATGRATGLVAGIAGAISFDLFAVEPYGSLTVSHRDDLVAVLVMAVIGVLVGHQAEQMASERARRAATEAELLELHALLELAAAGERPGRLITVAESALERALGLPCRYEAVPFLDNLPELHHTFLQVLPGDPGPLATSNLVQIPVRANSELIGRFVVELERPAPAALSLKWRPRATAIADQLGQALEQFPR